jgi:rhodanese-related sulfurtransferase
MDKDMKRLRILLTALLTVLFLGALNAQNPDCTGCFRNMDPDEFETLVKDRKNVVLVDVRTEKEYSEGHLKNAKLLDMRQDSFMDDALNTLPKDKTIAVYCRSGKRGAVASEKLAKSGYDVVNLDGGILAWQSAGKKIVHRTVKGTGTGHQQDPTQGA